MRVSAIVGRPPVFRDDAGESCTTGADPCSRVIKLERPPAGLQDPPTPCNTPWRYSITIEDESRLRAVEATANVDRRGPLRRDGSPSGAGGRWQSDVFAPLPAAVRLDFTIRADDAFGFFRTTVRSIQC